MAEILLSTLADALGGPVVADATFTATATRARAVGDGVVANKTITVPVVQGVPSEPILLDQSGVDWCWRLRVVFPSIGVRIDRTVAVPDVPSVEWADLVDVDPATLLPAESAVPAWTAAVGQVSAILADTAVARDGAVVAQGLSEAARDAAVIARGISEIARDGAVVAQGASEEARDQAQVYAANTVELQDTTFTALIADPGSETRAQLNATIAGEINTPTSVIETALSAKYAAKVERRGLISTGAGTSTRESFPSKALYRFAARLTPDVETIQIRYHNYNSIIDVSGTQPITLNVALGLPAYDATTGQMTGNFQSGSAVQLVTNQLITDSSGPWYSAPIDVGALPGTPGDMLLMSFHVSTTAAEGSRSWMRSNVQLWWKNEALASDLISGSVTAGSTSPPLGDFGIVTFSAGERCILVVGDSYADGFGNTPVNTVAGTHLSIPHRLADLSGVPVASTAVSGGLAQHFAERGDTSPIWEKVGFAGSKFTGALIVSHPNNDANAGRTVAQMQADYLTILGKLREKGIPRIVGATVPPRGNTDVGFLASATSIGATTITGGFNINSGASVVGYGPNAEAVTVTSSSGSGPFTMTLSAPLTKAHEAGEFYGKTTGPEAKRLAFNYWLRGRPSGLVDVIDLDALYRDPTAPNTLLASKRFDAVHLNGVEQDNVARLFKAALAP